MLKTFAATLLIAATAACAAHAATVHPSSYDMRNGASLDRFSFWDDSYSGQGNTKVDNSRLRGGLGDLTDGTIATENWSDVEGRSGPYVGWSSRVQAIAFNFDKAYRFDSATFHFDGNGGGGGAGAPLRIRINGDWQRVSGAGSDPFAFTFDLTGVSETDTLFVRILRPRNVEWTFLSEVTFDGDIAPIPLPASGLMLLAGMGGLAAWKRRAKKRD